MIMLWQVFEQVIATLTTFQLKYDYNKVQLWTLNFFALVSDEATSDTERDISWCMLFVDDVVLADDMDYGYRK